MLRQQQHIPRAPIISVFSLSLRRFALAGRSPLLLQALISASKSNIGSYLANAKFSLNMNQIARSATLKFFSLKVRTYKSNTESKK